MKAITQKNTTDFFFCKQENYLDKYKKIVTEHYKEELEIELDGPGSNWNIHTIKRSGDCMIALQNNTVIGGAMLYKTRGAQHQLLPLEAKRPLLENLYDMELANIPYCEVGRLAISKAYRSMPLITQLIDHIVTQSFQQGMHYLFVLAPTANAILYRRVCKRLDVQMNMIAFSGDLLPPVYQHLKFKLICVELLKCPKLNLNMTRQKPY